HEMGQYVPGHVDGNGETNALGRLDDSRIDADDLAGGVHEGSAAVARVQGGVGLDDIVNQVPGDGAEGPAQGADHAGSDRRFEAEWTADRHHQLTDAELGGIAEEAVRQ